MASYVLLTLDTTAPIFQIILPAYTTPTGITHITVQSNEQLSSYQNFYIIDILGNKTNLILGLSPDGTEYSTSIVLSNVAIGMATFYAQVQDTVWNMGNLQSQQFSMFKSEILMVSVSDEEFAKVDLFDNTTSTVYAVDGRTMKVDIEDGIYPR